MAMATLQVPTWSTLWERNSRRLEEPHDRGDGATHGRYYRQQFSRHRAHFYWNQESLCIRIHIVHAHLCLRLPLSINTSIRSLSRLSIVGLIEHFLLSPPSPNLGTENRWGRIRRNGWRSKVLDIDGVAGGAAHPTRPQRLVVLVGEAEFTTRWTSMKHSLLVGGRAPERAEEGSRGRRDLRRRRLCRSAAASR